MTTQIEGLLLFGLLNGILALVGYRYAIKESRERKKSSAGYYGFARKQK